MKRCPNQISSIASTQRRTLWILSTAQIFSGFGAGAVVSTGSLLAVEMTGSPAWAGSITTASTLGGAFASAALSRLAFSKGRRFSLSTGLAIAALGSALVIVSALLSFFPLLLLSGCMIGFGAAVNLQARFAATDLALPQHRGRDLSLIMWMSTVGAVAGPNMTGPGKLVGAWLGIPALSGIFVFSAIGMVGAMTVITVGLRPDPYLLSCELGSTQDNSPRSRFFEGVKALWEYKKARVALATIISSQAIMVAIMSMTPVHMDTHGASIEVVGLTVSLHIAGMYALSPVMGLLSDKLGPQPMMLLGIFAILVSAVTAAFSYSSVPTSIVALILLGLGWSASTVAASTLLNDAVPGPIRVATQGSSDALMGLAGGLGGALAGVMLATIGYLGLGIVGAVIAGITIVIVFSQWRRL